MTNNYQLQKTFNLIIDLMKASHLRCFFMPILRKMGLFTNLIKARDKPQNRTAWQQLQLLFGGTTSEKPMNAQLCG